MGSSPLWKERFCGKRVRIGKVIGGFAMWRFIIVTFGFLGFAFYQLSGGADYVPKDGSRQHAAQSAQAIKTPHSQARRKRPTMRHK